MIPPTKPGTFVPPSLIAQSPIVAHSNAKTACGALVALLERAQHQHELAAHVQQTLTLSLLTLSAEDKMAVYRTAQQADGSYMSLDFRLEGQVKVSSQIRGRTTHSCVLTLRHPAWECINKCRERVNLIAIWKEWASKCPSPVEQRDEALDRIMACSLLDEPELSLMNLGLTSLPERLPLCVRSLNISHNRLKDVNINYHHLTSLDVSNNPLITLSACYNKLTTLNTSHTSLVNLKLSRNQLNALPDLPVCVEKLDVSHNQLTALTNLPAKLKELVAVTNQIAVLQNLPAGLEVMVVDVNQLTTLPPLPPGLKTLYAGYNLLTTLPDLPRDLTQLYAKNNQLISLPRLPEKLKMLSVGKNSLVVIPPLPDGIDTLILNDNLLTQLPPLPKSISRLKVTNNYLPVKLTQSGEIILFEVTPQYHYSQNIIANSVHIPKILTLEVLFWSPENQYINFFQMWSPLTQEDGGVEFILFLNKFRSTLDIRAAEFKTWVCNFLTEIAGDAQLRKKVFIAADKAGSSCNDRAALSWNIMQIIRELHRVETHSDSITPAAFLRLLRQIFYLQKIENIAEEKFQNLLASGVDADQVEIYLKYLVDLKGALDLPQKFVPQMSYPMLSNVRKEDITQAKMSLLEAERLEFRHWFVNSEHCQNYLQSKMTADERNTFAEKRLALYSEIYEELKQIPVPEDDVDVVRELGKEAAIRTNHTLFGPLVEKTFFPGLKPPAQKNRTSQPIVSE